MGVDFLPTKNTQNGDSDRPKLGDEAYIEWTSPEDEKKGDGIVAGKKQGFLASFFGIKKKTGKEVDDDIKLRQQRKALISEIQKETFEQSKKGRDIKLDRVRHVYTGSAPKPTYIEPQVMAEIKPFDTLKFKEEEKPIVVKEKAPEKVLQPMIAKENKPGFFATLFAKKPKKPVERMDIILERDVKKGPIIKQEEVKKENKPGFFATLFAKKPKKPVEKIEKAEKAEQPMIAKENKPGFFARLFAKKPKKQAEKINIILERDAMKTSIVKEEVKKENKPGFFARLFAKKPKKPVEKNEKSQEKILLESSPKPIQAIKEIPKTEIANIDLLKNIKIEKTEPIMTAKKEMIEKKSEAVKEKIKLGVHATAVKDNVALWEDSNVLETNLLKDQLDMFFDWKKNFSYLAIFSILSLLIVAGAYWNLHTWGKEKNKETQLLIDRNATLASQVKKIKEQTKDASEFRDRLLLANKVLDQHVYWTNFFDFLKTHTLNNVFYFGFIGDTTGVYSLSAVGDDFDAIEAQIKEFYKNKNVKKVTSKEAVYSQGQSRAKDDSTGVSTQFELIIDNGIFYNSTSTK